MIRFRTLAPASKKNRGRIAYTNRGDKCQGCGRPKGRPFFSPSNAARRDEKRIREVAIAAASLPGFVEFPDEDVRVRIDVLCRPKCDPVIDVEVEAIGPRPKGFTGRKRDVHSHIDVTMDAIQGALIENDNQVAEIVIRRILG